MDIIQIVGLGRSGSTLLNQLLAESLDAVDVGELRFFFERGVQKNELCSCGKPFNDCNFWRSVLVEFRTNYGGCEDIDVIAKRYAKYQKMRNFPSVLLNQKCNDDFLRIERCLIEAIEMTIQGSDYIIDSSKVPVRSYLYSKLKVEKPNVYVVHLVRDPRAVSFSWAKRVLRPETHNKEEMARFSVQKSSALWLLVNTLSLGLKLIYRKNYYRIDYSKLCSNTQDEIHKLISSLRLNRCNVNSNAEKLHSISGNPMRFGKPKPVKDDSAWRNKMAKKDKYISSVIALWLYIVIR